MNTAKVYRINNQDMYQKKGTKNNLILFPTIVTTKNKKDECTKVKVYRGNGTVEPIRDLDDIKRAKEFLLNQPQRYFNLNNNVRNYCLFVLGCNCGRRIGDIRELKWSNLVRFIGNDFLVNDYISIIEQKTNKSIKIKINDSVKDAVVMYANAIKLSDDKLNTYVFISTKSNKDGEKVGITRTQAWRIFDSMSKAIGLKDKGVKIGTHSLRKTMGYHALRSNPNNPVLLATLQKAYNHSDSSITLRYCGIDQDDMDNLIGNINI